MTRKRRTLGAGFKTRVALAALKGDRTLAELADEFHVHPNQIVMWEKQSLNKLDLEKVAEAEHMEDEYREYAAARGILVADTGSD